MRDEGVIYVAGHPWLNGRCTRLPGCIRLRSDLYCVEWGVKLYSLTAGLETQVSGWEGGILSDANILHFLLLIFWKWFSGNDLPPHPMQNSPCLCFRVVNQYTESRIYSAVGKVTGVLVIEMQMHGSKSWGLVALWLRLQSTRHGSNSHPSRCLLHLMSSLSRICASVIRQFIWVVSRHTVQLSGPMGQWCCSFSWCLIEGRWIRDQRRPLARVWLATDFLLPNTVVNILTPIVRLWCCMYS